MIETWTAGGDFAQVLDTLEPVKILTNGCRDHAFEATAWRFRERRLASDEALAALIQTEVTWQIAIADGDRQPELGDLVIDSAGGCSTLRTVSPQQGATRLVCQASHLEISPASAERFDLTRPIWNETSEGPVLERIEQVRPAVVGYLKAASSDPNVVQSGFLYLVSPEPVQVGDRFQRHRGGQYEVTQIDEPKAIGQPWTIQVAGVAVTA